MSENLQIIMAQLSDLDDIQKIENLSFNSDGFSRRQFSYLIKNANSVFFVVKEAGNVLANLILLKRSGSAKLRMYSLAVHPNSRGKGIAHLLIEKTKSYAKEIGCNQIYLEVRTDNLIAIKLYQKEGFSKSGIKNKFYSDGCDAIVMNMSI